MVRDDPVDKFLPDFIPPAYGWSGYLNNAVDTTGLESERITLRQLASHLSGTIIVSFAGLFVIVTEQVLDVTIHLLIFPNGLPMDPSSFPGIVCPILPLFLRPLLNIHLSIYLGPTRFTLILHLHCLAPQMSLPTSSPVVIQIWNHKHMRTS